MWYLQNTKSAREEKHKWRKSHKNSLLLLWNSYKSSGFALKFKNSKAMGFEKMCYQYLEKYQIAPPQSRETQLTTQALVSHSLPSTSRDSYPTSWVPPTHKAPFTLPKIISDLTFPVILSLHLNFHLFPTLNFYRLYN